MNWNDWNWIAGSRQGVEHLPDIGHVDPGRSERPAPVELSDVHRRPLRWTVRAAAVLPPHGRSGRPILLSPCSCCSCCCSCCGCGCWHYSASARRRTHRSLLTLPGCYLLPTSNYSLNEANANTILLFMKILQFFVQNLEKKSNFFPKFSVSMWKFKEKVNFLSKFDSILFSISKQIKFTPTFSVFMSNFDS